MYLVYLLVSLLTLLANFLLDLFLDNIIFFLVSILGTSSTTTWDAFSNPSTASGNMLSNPPPLDRTRQKHPVYCVGDGSSTMSGSPSSIIGRLIISSSVSSSSIARDSVSWWWYDSFLNYLQKEIQKAQLVYDSRHQKKISKEVWMMCHKRTFIFFEVVKKPKTSFLLQGSSSKSSFGPPGNSHLFFCRKLELPQV